MPNSQYRMGSKAVMYDYLLDGNVPKKPLKVKYKTEGQQKKVAKKKPKKK